MTQDNTHIILTPEVPLERLKNRILEAIYQESQALGPLVGTAATAEIRGETDEKYLRQILAACRQFGRTGHPGYQRLRTRLRDRTRGKTPEYRDAQTWETALDLNTWQTQALFRHAITFQLTSGCSNYCRRCNEWALPGIRTHFSRIAVESIIRRLLDLGNDDLALYGGSDPLDWTDPPHDLADVLDRLPTPCRFSILTKIPRGRQALARNLVENGIPLSVSLTDRNRERIQALEDEMGQALTKQHATPDLLIPACLDEDFVSVKPSITDSYGTEISPDGACIVIPTFTSALHPFGHKKIPVTRQTSFFPVKKLGRPALLVDYFKPLEVEGPRGRYHLDRLLDVQVENILLDNGAYELTPPGMRSVKEYFEIFEDRAVEKRKQNTLSVVRRLKKEYLSATAFKDLPGPRKTEYRSRLQAHLDFTRRSHVAAARVSAASFFLAAIRAYAELEPVNLKIITRLTREENKKLQAAPIPEIPLSRLFSDPGLDAWMLFRRLALCLVHGSGTGPIDPFLSGHPAVYNPLTDRFEPDGRL